MGGRARQCRELVKSAHESSFSGYDRFLTRTFDRAARWPKELSASMKCTRIPYTPGLYSGAFLPGDVDVARGSKIYES